MKRIARSISSIVGRRPCNVHLLWSAVRRLWSASILLLLVACSPTARGAGPTFAAPPTTAPSVGATHTADYGVVAEIVETRGRVVAKQEALLVFPLGGALKTVHVSPGDQVEAGDTLAELDALYVAREVLDQGFDVSIAELALTREETEARSQVALAEVEVTMAQVDVERAEAQVALDEAQLARARAALGRAQAQMSQAQVQYNATVLSGDVTINHAERAEAEGRCNAWCQLDLHQTRLQVVAANDVAQAAVDSAQAGLSVPQAEVKVAQAQLSVTQSEVQMAQAHLQKAQASLNLITSTHSLDVDIARERGERAHALHELASEQLSSTLLLAPFTGIIISIERPPGDQIDAYESIGALADPSELWIVASVLEEEIDRVTAGQSAIVQLDAYPNQAYTGSVLQIASQAIIWQGKSAYEVTIAFDEGQAVPATIRMGADVSIAGPSRENVLVVPARAVIKIGGHTYVEIVVGEGGKVERVEVQTGVSDGSETEIVAGLQAGQMIRIP